MTGLLRAAVAGLLIIIALFVADAAGAPDGLGDVASAGWAAMATACGLVLLRRASAHRERLLAGVLTGAGALLFVLWIADLAT